MLYPSLAIIIGLVLLVWSADRFVEGSANSAGHFGMPPLLIGMLILGFGTSAPEIVISTMSSLDGKSSLALGNAFGSNISNIALILGATAIFMPILVQSKILKKELPLLTGVTLIATFMMKDGYLSRIESFGLLGMFLLFVGWTIWQGLSNPKDILGEEMQAELDEHKAPLGKSLFWMALGFAILLGSSRLLVWGAVEVATFFGVSELIIGLTIVAVGTSLPELASTFAAAKKGEHDIAMGNVLGSNLFNTLAVAGLAGAIQPLAVGPEVFTRDSMVMSALTISLFVFGYGFKGRQGRINRFEAAILLAAYIAYTVYLIQSVRG